MSAIATILAFLPFIFIIWLANLADGRRERGESGTTAAVVTYLLLGGFYGLLVFVGLLLQLVGPLIWQNPALEQTGIDPTLMQDVVASLPILGLGMWLPSLIALILLLPPVRRALARLIPIDPASTVHAVALSYTMLIVINMAVTLGVGLENLSESLAAQGETGAVGLADLWAQELIMAFWAVVGVGWLSRRSLAQVLARLGIVKPTRREVLIGVGVAIVMVPVVLTLEALAAQFGFGPEQAVEDLMEQLLGGLFSSLPGVLSIGLAAAIGEETLFRGALQPRFGLVLTSLMFALVHSNYGVSTATLVVFILGLVLGILRKRYNTTTSMITHATYNTTLASLSYLGLQFLQNQ